MNDNINSTQEVSADSPADVTGEESINDAPQAQQSDEVLQDLAAQFLNIAPEKPAEQDVESLQEPAEEIEAGGEEIAEEAEDEAETEQLIEEVAEESPDSIVDYDELKNHTLQFNVGGEQRNMTIDQIVSELGQVKAASKSQGEVKAQQEEIQSQKKALEDQQAWIDQQMKANVESKELGAKRAKIEDLNAQLENARKNEDLVDMIKFKDQLDVAVGDYRKTEATVKQHQQQAEARHLAAQEKKLNELGYGTILSDNQRVKSINEYLTSNLSPQAVEAVNYDATLLVAVEKARLWDKSQTASKTKGKLKVSGKKTLKSGSGKIIRKDTPAKPADPFLEFSKSVLGQG